MKSEKNSSKNSLEYKQKPLIRCGNTIYYGNSNDKFVVRMDIKEIEDDSNKNLKVSKSISVNLVDNSRGFYRQKTLKTSLKKNLCLAMDIADIWLERALNE